jgi:hypothetical protein
MVKAGAVLDAPRILAGDTFINTLSQHAMVGLSAWSSTEQFISPSPTVGRRATGSGGQPAVDDGARRQPPLASWPQTGMTRSMPSGVLSKIPARHNLAAYGIGVVAHQPGLAIPNCPQYLQSL